MKSGGSDRFALEAGLLEAASGFGAEGLCGGARGGLGTAALVGGLGDHGLELLLLGAKAGSAGKGGGLLCSVCHESIFSWDGCFPLAK